jgi:glycosyltransferase involved in cell wall biosynthesis
LLKKNNYELHVAPFWPKKAWDILYEKGHLFRKAMYLILGYIKRWALLFTVPGYSIVFIHREATPVGPPFIEYIIIRILRKKVIYDFDDAIWLPNTSEQNSIATKLKWHSKVKKICRWSWKVSCGNTFLAEFARKYNKDAEVNPTTIDPDYHKPAKNKNQKPVIGWTGTHSTSKYLESLTGVFKKLKNKYDFDVVIISNQKPEWDFDDFSFLRWSKSREIDDLNKFDIGIMPLEDTVWEQGKCGFKALQYMSMEIPAVVSDVGVNNQIIDQGVDGFLCREENDWIQFLSRLLESEILRQKIGVNGRQKVTRSYSVGSNANRFLSLFT